MKREMFRKLMAVSLATVMTVGLAGCGEEAAPSTESKESKPAESKSEEPVASSEEEDLGAYTVLKDANGNVYDLGGMEVIIRDWWSSGERSEEPTKFEEAKYEYLDWAMETYNFTIKEVAISDWGSAPQDFIDYVTTGGDDNNYVFTVRADASSTSAMYNGLMYDLSTLDRLDFSEAKFPRNKLHEVFTWGDKICAMHTGYAEPRTGMYFNKRLLTEAGIDPDSIYEMQANGTWTWQAWFDMMDKIQVDRDNDGKVDVAGFDANHGAVVCQAVYSNYSEFVGKDANGAFVWKGEDPATIEALEFYVEACKKYGYVHGEDETQWDFYKTAFENGYCAFCPEDEYAGTPGNFLANEMNDEIGFAFFPKGPQAADYINCWSDNPQVIPACYDADKAWKIAFAYNIYTNDVPGYEGYQDLSAARKGKFDARSIDETVAPMSDPAKGMVTYHGMVPNMNPYPDFIWAFNAGCESVQATIDGKKNEFITLIDEANAAAGK
ncbi:MAG: hypothetical protein MJ114_01775 [Acetatifactor sp.]|nr:hypothetical protein [Acetatifactor sp.]